MKQTFSTTWKKSKQVRKQRKYQANAPLHTTSKFLNAHLSKPLKTKYKQRSIRVRKGDTVKIMRGQNKGTEAKIHEVNSKLQKVYIEGITKTKKDGSIIFTPLHASNLLITKLIDDKKRFKRQQK